jgi:hypothetical protein
MTAAAAASLHVAIEPEELHRSLSRLNDARLRPRLDAPMPLTVEMDLRADEAMFLEAERAAVAASAAMVPEEPRAFLDWYESLRENGPGQNDRLFAFLANEASLDQLAWFLAQEVAGEAGFDDLVALTQLRMATGPKLEMARNYWDEMGRGKEGGMHGPMLERLAADLAVRERGFDIVWESVALGNLLAGLAANRHYAFQSVGALGIVELTAPSRAAQVDAGLRRLRLPARTRQYFALHATLDVRHSRSWNDEVVLPLVSSNPRTARAIAEGALMRLRAGERCFERYRRELGIS